MPKPKHGYDKPLTEKGELSDRGRTKLKGQIQHAEMIMRTEKLANRSTSKAYYQAQRTKHRAEKLLSKETAKKPAKKEDEAARRRKPFEKATGTGRLKEALIGVAKRAQQANEK